MIGNTGGIARIVVAVFIAAAIVAGGCAGAITGKVAARANINDYLSKGPNEFYPARHDVNGSMAKQVIDVLGWNATSIDGNVGIGDGSVSVFDLTGTHEVDYPDNAFMCGDVSTQLWQPDGNTTASNDSGNVTMPTGNLSTGEEGQNATSNLEQADDEGENLTYTAYHPIQYLSPVKDILYEHPLATPGTAYCELLGFEIPSGEKVNVGMKCTGYGY